MPSNEVRVDADVTIKDAKEVFLKRTRASLLISSAALCVQDGITFLKLEPGRFYSISKVLMSRCDRALRKRTAQSPQHFWKHKGAKGKRFLDHIRSLRKAALAKKYGVVGARFMSRRKEQRVKQLIIENTYIELPAVGDRPPLGVCTIFDVESQRKNGRQSLWIEMTSSVLEHLSHMAEVSFGEDIASDDHDSEDIDDADDGDTDDTDAECVVSPEHGEEVVAEHKDDGATEQDNVNGSGGNDTSIVKRERPSFPIFAALARGSTNN